ncbi:MAG: S8 family serine peptidase [Lactobacillales bacterium]|jgi:LPXTG-motif cell wall-anchored protein|nr:S8 family serine peptidase [Lactobacillales bacterium]
MKARNKATLMLGVLAAASAMNFALAVPALTYAAQNDSHAGSTLGEMKKAFEKQQGDEFVKDSDTGKKSSKKFKDTLVDVVVELKAKPGVAHTSLPADGSKESLAEIDSASDSVIDAQAKVKKRVKKITGHAFNKKHDRNFGYLVNAFTTKAKLSELDSIAKVDGVKSVGEINTYKTQDVHANNLSKVQEAWDGTALPDYKLRGEGMVIAIIDTGIDWKHDDLQHDPDSAKLSKDSVQKIIDENDLKGHYLTPKIPYAYNYADENSDVKDLDKNSQHGMHVAGIAAADGTDYLKDSARAEGKLSDEEIDKLVADNKSHVDGAAPEAQLLDLKVFSNGDGIDGCETPAIVAAIEDAVKLGADVISMSLGADNGEIGTNLEQIAISKAAEAGIISVVAAGNAGNYNSYANTDQYVKGLGIGASPLSQTVGAPSISPDALSVAASQNQSAAPVGLGIYTEDDKRLQLFDSVEGVLYGPFSKGTQNDSLLDSFPDGNLNIVTLNDNHAKYWEDMRTEMHKSVIDRLASVGINLADGEKYSNDSFDSSHVNDLRIEESEEDSPAMAFNPYSSALQFNGLQKASSANGMVTIDKMAGPYDHWQHDPEGLHLGQGYQTDLAGYTGNWHQPLDSNLDSSKYPGTDINGKVVIVPYTEYEGFRGYDPSRDLEKNLKDAGAVGIIFVAPKWMTPSFEEDYLGFMTLSPYFGVDLPAIVIPQNDGIELAKNIKALNDEAIKNHKDLPKYQVKHADKEFVNKHPGQMANYSSYGPTDDLELKPEITAVGSDVWSLKNNNGFQHKSGTSMATPETSGITALLLQYLKSFDNHKTGKALIKQAKNLLMNSATPIFESPISTEYQKKDTENYSINLNEEDKLKWSDIDLDSTYEATLKDSFKAQTTLVAPRRQGAGQINASRALSTTTLLTDKKDGDVSLALKEFKQHTSFEVELTNFGKVAKSYQLDSTYDRVYAQNEIVDENLSNGLSINRILDFPLKKSVASLTLTKDGSEIGDGVITLAPGESVTISGSLDIKDPNFKDNWVEGYVGVKNVESDETAVIPYFGYTGKIDEAPIFDKFHGEEGAVSNKMHFSVGTLDTEGSRLTGIDRSAAGHDVFNENEIAFSPKNKDVLIPTITVLRNNKLLEFNILDGDKNLITTTKMTGHETPNSMRIGRQNTYTGNNIKWDGKKVNTATGEAEIVPDGKYYYQFKGIGSRDGDTVQTRDVPIVVDNTPTKFADVSVEKDSDGKYYVNATITENGSGFYDATTFGVGVNGVIGNLRPCKDILGAGFKGTKKIHEPLPEEIASRIVGGENDFLIGVYDIAHNEGYFENTITIDGGEPEQSFRLTRPFCDVGFDDAYVTPYESQVDVSHQLVHIKGYSSKAFYVNKTTKVKPENNQFDVWVPYDFDQIHSGFAKLLDGDGNQQNVPEDLLVDLKLSYDAEGIDQFKKLTYVFDYSASYGKPTFVPSNSYDGSVYVRDSAQISLGGEDVANEMARLETDESYAHDSIVIRKKERIWLTIGEEIKINPSQTYALEDSGPELPIAQVIEQRKDDRFALINLSAHEYYSNGKVYTKDGDELPAQMFKADSANNNAITTSFKTLIGGNVIEIKDIDNPEYNSFTLVDEVTNGATRFNCRITDTTVVGIGDVKSGLYQITDPVTGDGIYKAAGILDYDEYDLHILKGDEVANESNRLDTGVRDGRTGIMQWAIDLPLKNNSTTSYAWTCKSDVVGQLPMGTLSFYVDVKAPILNLSDSFKRVGDYPGPPDLIDSQYDNVNDLGDFTTVAKDGKFDLKGVFGDNQGHFTLKVNGSMVYRSEHENMDGIWQGEQVDLGDVDFKNSLKLIPCVDNHFVVDVTDLAGNITRAHILVKPEGAEPDVAPPGDDSSTDSQDLGNPDSQTPSDSTDAQDSSAPQGADSIPAYVVTSDSLVDANRGGVSIDPTQTSRDIRIAIDNPSVNAGDTITAYIYSDPTLLGTYTVQEDSDGKYINVKIPDGFTGDHKIALYNASGELVGWTPVTLASGSVATPTDLPTTGSASAGKGNLPTTGIHLPQTGEEAAAWIAYAGIVILAVGGTFVFLRRRKISE